MYIFVTDPYIRRRSKIPRKEGNSDCQREEQVQLQKFQEFI